MRNRFYCLGIYHGFDKQVQIFRQKSMKRNLQPWLLMMLLAFSACKKEEYSDSINYNHPNCNFLSKDQQDITFTGSLYITSKGELWFDAHNSSKRLLLICPQLRNSINSNYDTFLNLKNNEECTFIIAIYGHYLEGRPTKHLYERSPFFVHQISYL